MLFTRRVCTNTVGDKPPAKEKKGKEAPRTGLGPIFSISWLSKSFGNGYI
jgi:hypothetical protein